MHAMNPLLKNCQLSQSVEIVTALLLFHLKHIKAVEYEIWTTPNTWDLLNKAVKNPWGKRRMLNALTHLESNAKQPMDYRNLIRVNQQINSFWF